MSKIDMGAFGLPGITYHFAGKTRYFQKANGEKISCKAAPWDIKSEEKGNFAIFCGVTLEQLEEAFVALSDTLSEKSKKTQTGTAKNVNYTWEDAVEYSGKGDQLKLNYSVIGKLLSDNFIRVDDILMRATNNVAKPVSKEMLTREVISHLDEIQAGNLWNTQSCTLVRDQILAACKSKKVGQVAGFLPVRNGVLDLTNMELIQTEDVYLSSVSADYDPEATCPAIEELFDNAFLPDQKEMVLSILGAALSGRRAPFILCLSGQGRNGKSVIRELLRLLMEEMYTSTQIENVTKQFSNQAFIGRRVIWQTEVSSKRMFTDRLKDITGGTTLTVEYKFANGMVQYDLQSVVVIDTNHPPPLEQSVAIKDRLRFIDMPRHFVYELSGAPNEVLINQKLLEQANTEMSGFLNLLAKYAQHFILKGQLKYDNKNGLEAYSEKADSLGQFIDKWCDTGEYDTVSIKTFCKYYRMFAEKNNVAALTDSQIRYQLQKEFNFRVRGMTVTGVCPKRQELLSAYSDDIKM